LIPLIVISSQRKIFIDLVIWCTAVYSARHRPCGAALAESSHSRYKFREQGQALTRRFIDQFNAFWSAMLDGTYASKSATFNRWQMCQLKQIKDRCWYDKKRRLKWLEGSPSSKDNIINKPSSPVPHEDQ
jgi:hypothetical protein